jgi:hypothetical protein
MKEPHPPIIDYQRRSERLTLREWWELAPRRFTLLICLILNWALYASFSLAIGGDAFNTTPSTQGYVVVDHGRCTTVTKAIWHLSLFYTAATLLMMPLVLAFLVSSLIRGMLQKRSLYRRAIYLLCVLVLPWEYLVFRSVVQSALDAWRLTRLWPTLSWLALVTAIALAVVFLIGAEYEWKRYDHLEQRRAVKRQLKKAEDSAQRREI